MRTLMRGLWGIMIFLNFPLFSQSTVRLYPTADTEMNQNGGGSFAGASGAFQIYPWTASFSKRAAIRFDLTPYTGCTISSAWLVLMEQSTNTISRQINVHRVTTDWSENATHWTTPWTTSGGDYAASAVSSFTPVWTSVFKQDSVNLTTSVQSFVNGTYPNYGWILKIATEDNTQQYWAYYSKETATLAYRPILRVRFSGCSALPVELLDFNASSKDNTKIELSWRTASEVNNDFFTVESSIDGINWSELKQIKGAGNSTAVLNYSTVDEHPYFGTSYYRLKQTDYDGKFSYSAVKDVSMLSPRAKVVLYPNPAQDAIIINGNESELNKIRIYDLLGKDVTNQIKEVKIHSTQLSIDLKNLNAGLYYLRTPNSTTKLYKQ